VAFEIIRNDTIFYQHNYNFDAGLELLLNNLVSGEKAAFEFFNVFVTEQSCC